MYFICARFAIISRSKFRNFHSDSEFWMPTSNVRLHITRICMGRTIIFIQSHIFLIDHFIFSTKIFITSWFIITIFMCIKSIRMWQMLCTTAIHSWNHLQFQICRKLLWNEIKVNICWAVIFYSEHTSHLKCLLPHIIYLAKNVVEFVYFIGMHNSNEVWYENTAKENSYRDKNILS